MPRTGGDYAWQSRVLGGGIAFVLAVTGWWFILWLLGADLRQHPGRHVPAPLRRDTGPDRRRHASSQPQTGIFVSCLIPRLRERRGDAGHGGLRADPEGLLLHRAGGPGRHGPAPALQQPDRLPGGVQPRGDSLFGAPAGAYQATIDAAAQAGYTPISLTAFDFGPTLLLIPFVVFFLLWPNWGATLYGEVRGAKDFRRPFCEHVLGPLGDRRPGGRWSCC